MKIAKYWVIQYDYRTNYGKDSDEAVKWSEESALEFVQTLKNDDSVYHYIVKEITEVRK